MIVSVHQPQFMPWLGYLDKIAQSDVFVLLDNVQYKKNEWQNRNRIKNSTGWQWLTVPVLYKFPQKIYEVGVAANNWQANHQNSLRTNYSKAPFYAEFIGFFDKLFSQKWDRLLDLNVFSLEQILSILGIKTPIYLSSELGSFPENPDDRLIAISKHFKATTYLAGNGGKAYMDEDKYSQAGIEVRFQEYDHPVYPQLFGQFEYYLSVLDLIFNCGPQSLSILKGQ